MAESSDHQTDEDLFDQFLERVRDQAAKNPHLVVKAGLVPNTIQWGEVSRPHLYSFDPKRAREEGMDAIVDEAVARIRSDPP